MAITEGSESIDVVSGKVGIAEPIWHYVGAAGEPAFLNSWRNSGGGEGVVRFCKDAMGFVHLEGNAVAGSLGAVGFQLPAGFRPLQRTNLMINAGASGSGPPNSSGTVVIDLGGNVIFFQAGGTAYFNLYNISFYAGMGDVPGVTSFARSLLAYSLVDSVGAGVGRGINPYAATGGNAQSVAINAGGLTSLALGASGFPVTPGQVLRVSFSLQYHGAVSTGQETYIRLRQSVDFSATYTDVGQVSVTPASAQAPSPQGEFLVIVPAGATYLSLELFAQTNTGSTTIGRYNSSAQFANSHFTVEDISSSVVPSKPPVWRTVGNPGEPTFQGTWVNADPNFMSLGFCKQNNIVRLRGLVKGGVAAQLMVLPSGYRPSKISRHVAAYRGVAACVIDISPSGQITVAGANDASEFVTLDGITFDADGS